MNVSKVSIGSERELLTPTDVWGKNRDKRELINLSEQENELILAEVASGEEIEEYYNKKKLKAPPLSQ